MNYRKIYESAKLDEELLQEFNFKKAAAVGLMGLGLASGAFAKSNKSQHQKSKVISQQDFLNKCIEFIDEEGPESRYYTLEDMLDMLEADGIKVDGVVDYGENHALKGNPGKIKGFLSKKGIQKALQNGGTLDSFTGFLATN